MLVEFDFLVLQLRYIHEAMAQILTYRPLGLTLADVSAQIIAAAPPRTAYIAAKTVLDGGRADRRISIDTLHDACVDFATQARNVFRKNPNVTERLDRLPVKDQSFQDTLTRADAVLALWATLPQVGTPAADFRVKQGPVLLDETGFTALRTAVGATHTSIPQVDQAFQKAEADLHAKQRGMEELVTSALTEGRSQFDEGNPEREIIDAIPTEAPAGPPGKAEITSASNIGTGIVRLTYQADGATSFDIYERAEGAPTFTLVAEDILAATFDVPSLSPGPHEFTVRGRNARGLGATSDVTTVEVAE